MAELSLASVSDQIARQCALRPNQVALADSNRAVSYAQLGAMVDRVAASLQRDGVKAGDSVALCATSTLEYAAVMLGVLRCGAVVVPLPNSATAQVQAGLLNDCDARMFFLDAPIAELCAPLPLLQRLKCIRLDESVGGPTLSAWLAPAGSTPRPVHGSGDAPFNIIYSSGTTGAPKGIVHPHSLRSAQVARSANLGYGASSITLLATPLYSNITLTGFYPTLALGGTV